MIDILQILVIVINILVVIPLCIMVLLQIRRIKRRTEKLRNTAIRHSRLLREIGDPPDDLEKP